MADKGNLMPLVLLGGAAAALYFWWNSSSTPAPAATASGQVPTSPGASVIPITAGQPAATPPATPAAPGFNSLAAIYLRLTAQVQANSTDPAITQQQGQFFATPSVFNYYLGQVSQYMLDSTGMAAAFPGGDVAMSLPAFWGAASQYLATNKGLSGLGLFQGLAGYRGRR